MRKKLLVLSLITVLVVSFSTISYAASTQDKLNKVTSQKDDVSEDLNTMKNEISEQQSSIDALQKTINKKSAELSAAESKLNATKKKIAQRKDGLEKRLRAMYKNGSVGYIDIILSSQNITDLVANIEMVQKIYQNDENILGTLKSQKHDIEVQEAKLKDEKSSLDSKQSKLTAKKSEMQTVKGKLQAKYNELVAEEDQFRAAIAASTGSNGGSYGGGIFCWPTTSHIITSQFNEARSYEFHPGIDIGVASGSPTYAAADGIVTIAGWYGSYNKSRGGYGYGKCVGIKHGGGLVTIYGHNSKILVSVGQKVKKGQIIARTGSTGWSSGPHLHFEVRKNDNAVSPWTYLK